VDAKVGDTIEWVNNDVFDHTATVKGQWDVQIPAGQKGRLVLKKAGTFAYFCRFHPNMKATLVVTK
jgi:plastocyanin